MEHALVCNAYVDHLGSRTLNGSKASKKLTSGQKGKYSQARKKYANGEEILR